MKDVPEIAPEVRGLIEEIVANPRSNLRLTPRRALLPWLESGETVRASDVSDDVATRHLVAAHREAVAKLLREAAHIAYWKAPLLAHKPTRVNGEQFDPSREEFDWQQRAASRVGTSRHADAGVSLLKSCLETVASERGAELARASLGLLRSDHAIVALGEHICAVQPRTSYRLFLDVTRLAKSCSVRAHAWGCVGKALCFQGRFREAVASYERASDAWSSAWFPLFNLACLTKQNELALRTAIQIGELWHPDSSQVAEATQLFSEWARGLSHVWFAAARKTVAEICRELPESGRRVAHVYQ